MGEIKFDVIINFEVANQMVPCNASYLPFSLYIKWTWGSYCARVTNVKLKTP